MLEKASKGKDGNFGYDSFIRFNLIQIKWVWV